MPYKNYLSVAVCALLIAFGVKTVFGNTKNNLNQIFNTSNNTLIKPKIQNQSIPKCRPFNLSYLELIAREKLHQLKALSNTEFKAYQIESIDAFYDPLYKYHFVDSVCVNSNGSLILIAREYDNENIIWLCNYDKNNILLHTKQVFYDNAEGNFQIESKLISNILTLKTDDVNEGKGQEKYKITTELKLVKIK
ncbi:MAG: hypothetical protein IPQ02_01740 [Saprospiraceae bacterium]|nr:hypothetical protein [Candidatus Defluviibacterium haderslevense]